MITTPSQLYFNYQLNLKANAGKSRDEVWELTCEIWKTIRWGKK